jgi:hypothetical protein
MALVPEQRPLAHGWAGEPLNPSQLLDATGRPIRRATTQRMHLDHVSASHMR